MRYLLWSLPGFRSHEKKVLKPYNESDLIAKGWRRVIIQPNGWGMTREQAIRDLDRVMRLYENEPGFRRYDYVSLVRISKRRYQSDGRCSFLAPPIPSR